jgi:hypothetical protein
MGIAVLEIVVVPIFMDESVRFLHGNDNVVLNHVG